MKAIPRQNHDKLNGKQPLAASSSLDPTTGPSNKRKKVTVSSALTASNHFAGSFDAFPNFSDDKTLLVNKVLRADSYNKTVLAHFENAGRLAGDPNLLEDHAEAMGLRVISEQFAEYQGVMKAWNNDHNPNRWVKQLNKKKLPYLHSYAPPSPALLEGRAIQFHNHRDIYLLKNGTRHAFPSFDTFTEVNFSLDVVQLIASKYLHLFPLGDPLPSLS